MGAVYHPAVVHPARWLVLLLSLVGILIPASRMPLPQGGPRPVVSAVREEARAGEGDAVSPPDWAYLDALRTSARGRPAHRPLRQNHRFEGAFVRPEGWTPAMREVDAAHGAASRERGSPSGPRRTPLRI